MSIIKQQEYSTHYLSTVRLKEPVLVWYVSVDIPVVNSPAFEATALLYSDLLLSGAGKYTRQGFLKAVNELGATVSVSYSAGRFTYVVTARAAASRAIASLVATMLTAPAFTANELTRARRVLINSLMVAKDDARSTARDGLYRALYPSQHLLYPYTPDELIAATKHISISKVKALHTLVRAHRPTVTFAGSETLQKGWVTLATKNFNGSIIDIETNPAQNNYQQRVVLNEIPGKDNVEFSIGTSVRITQDDKMFPALLLGVAILGKWGGFTGRLMQRIREEQGLTYGIFARMSEITKREFGLLRIMTFFAPDKAALGVRQTLKEYRTIIKEGITSDELRRFKIIMKTQFVIMHDVPNSLVDLIHNGACIGQSYEDFTTLYDALQKLTVRDVNVALKTHLDPKRIIIAGAGPTATLRKKLEPLL